MWHSAADRWPSRIGAFNSSALRLRTAIQEVAEMGSDRVAPLLNVLTSFPLRIEHAGGDCQIRADHVAFAAVENHADFRAQQIVGLQPAHFEDQRLLGPEVEDRDFGVRRVAGIFVSESAAVAEHAIGQRFEAEAPAGDIHLMHALVADVAIAVGPLPMPVVMEMRAA